MGIEWKELAIQIPIVIALVTLVKKLTDEKLGQWYMLIAIGFAFAVVGLGTIETFNVVDFVRQSIVAGLTAAGVYNVANKIGTGG